LTKSHVYYDQGVAILSFAFFGGGCNQEWALCLKYSINLSWQNYLEVQPLAMFGMQLQGHQCSRMSNPSLQAIDLGQLQ
jgi:hypothetical protein